MPSTWPVAVIFDFDGVLVNSEPLHYLAFHDVLAKEGIELTETEYYNEMIGFDDRGAFNHIFKVHGRALDPKTFLRVMTLKSEKMRELIEGRRDLALPGAEEFVRGLWRNYPLAVCSGALREEIELMLEAAALRDCFSVIVSAEDVTVGKPDPQGYLLTSRLISEKIHKPTKPRDFLIVEDAPTVLKSVRKVGFPTLAVATTYSIDKLSDADWATPSLRPNDVLKVLPELNVFR
jgi:HAD superfamily hydrolase (TIGR01509 family)